jgi:hypothetical protein
MDFRALCNLKGLVILREDVNFVRNCLFKLPKSSHRSVMSNYIREWMSGMYIDTIESRKQNSGRFRANSWLREYVSLRGL